MASLDGVAFTIGLDVVVRPLFYLATNGITVICDEAEVYDSGSVNGTVYTKLSRDDLDVLVAAGDFAPLTTACTSGITDWRDLFWEESGFNEDISSWDVSSVRLIGGMFAYASSFNQPLNSWDMSTVIETDLMFHGASSFNQPIGSWDVSNVTRMRSMFHQASSFNQPLSSWDVGTVIDMGEMFREATSFNASLADWDVSSVTDMGLMDMSPRSWT